MERLKDLLTILYRPRETMRGILDRSDRWSVQIVALAFVCASVNDSDVRHVSEVLSPIGILPLIALVALSIVIGAIAWVITLFILTWIATPIGRMLGGTGTMADVRAALAWGMVPVVWSPLYRVPLVLLGSRFHVGPQVNVREVLLNFVAHGGCSIVVIYLAFQTLFLIWSVIVASFTVAEAHRFSTQKGFVNVVSTIALPLMVIAAAMFSLRGFTG